MKTQMLQRGAAALACLGMLIPQAALAEMTVPTPVADVALGEGGLFVGKVVTAQGQAVAKTRVALLENGAEIVQATTNDEGQFAAKGLHSGVYQVATEQGAATFRLWEAEVAPPASNTSALIVTGTVVNGQYCNSCNGTCSGNCGRGGGGGGVMGWIKNHPMLVAAGVATAIAVPLAVADDDDPATP